jgi:hypothetical protein
VLYHATFSELSLDVPVTPRGPTQVYPNAVARLEAAKLHGKPSRSLCVFATDNLAGATKFAMKQCPDHTMPLLVYSVEMAVFHKAPMRIVSTLDYRLTQGRAVDNLIMEYWNPNPPWEFYEFFGPSFIPTALVAPASAGAIMVFDSRYLQDGDHVNSLCADS